MTPQELKNSILQLAIQGKLVEQRPEEGTAEELFAQIQQEKQRLIAENKIKKEKPLPEITDDEKPFDIPDSWKWVRLRNIVYNRGQLAPQCTFSYIDIGSINNQRQILNEKETIIEANKAPSRARKIVGQGDILYSTVRPYLHNMCIVNKVFSNMPIASTGFAVLTCYPSVFNKYLFYYLMTPAFDKYANSNENAKGVAYPAINDDRLYRAVIAFPPLGEQKRIVAKIEALLPYIDRYEQAWSKLEQFNSRFPEDMKKSLLQYAIQGKLVEQRPEEGTAEELFTQIQQEKQRLISEKKIKKEKSLPEITEDEKTFDIPENWKWIRLGSILHYIDTGKSFKCDEIPPTGNKCGIIKVSAVTWGKFNENESKTCYSNESWVDAYEIHKNDFLICRANTAALVGGCVIVDKISKRLMLSDKVLRLHFTKMIYPFYVLWALRTPFVRNQFGSMATGTSESMKNISQDILKNTVIPLPPIPEQKRIVEELEQLLPLCERLKGF